MPTPTNNKKILVVEDNAITLKIYRNRFSAAGFDVVETPTANDALELAKKNNPSAFVLDLMLQDGDGFGIIRDLRATPEFKDTPIIVLSNLSQQSDVNEATKAGADRFFVKSDTNLSEVIDTIKSLVA